MTPADAPDGAPLNQTLWWSPTDKHPSVLRKMKSIYLESSVVSYLAARPSRDVVGAGNHQVTRDRWEMRRGECELFVSDVVFAECAASDPTAASEREVFLGGLPVLTTTEEADTLALALLSAMALPEKAALDALHIGVAAANGMDTNAADAEDRAADLKRLAQVECVAASRPAHRLRPEETRRPESDSHRSENGSAVAPGPSGSRTSPG